MFTHCRFTMQKRPCNRYSSHLHGFSWPISSFFPAYSVAMAFSPFSRGLFLVSSTPSYF